MPIRSVTQSNHNTNSLHYTNPTHRSPIHYPHQDNSSRRYWDHPNRKYFHYPNYNNHPITSYVYYDNTLPSDYDNIYAYPECQQYQYCRNNLANREQCQECIKFMGGSNACAISRC